MAEVNSKTIDYWRKREQAYQESQKATDEAVAKRMNENLQIAKDNIQAQINSFYERYSAKSGMSIEEAQKAVSKFDIKAFENKAKEYVENKDFSAKANAELKLYNATMRINRLEYLKAEIGLEMAKATSANEQLISDSLESQKMNELKRQAGILGESLGNLQAGLKSQTEGNYQTASFSETLWQNNSEMNAELGNVIRRAIMMGENPVTKASAFQRTFEKAFEKNSYNAKRLLVTETAKVQADMQRSVYKTNGYDKYVYIAEVGACKICAPIDGKVFDVADMQEGKNMFPMHPFCRCSTAPYYEIPSKTKDALTTSEDTLKAEKTAKSDIISYKEVTPEIEKALQKQSDKLYKNMFLEERYAFDGYTNADYRTINEYLRGINKDGVTWPEDSVKLIDKVLSNNRIDKDLVLYRGVSPEEFELWKKGEKWDTYLSTSIDPEVVSTVFEEDEYGNKRRLVEIHASRTTKGIYIGENTAVMNEKEMLLHRGQKYKILEENENRIKVEVVSE